MFELFRIHAIPVNVPGNDASVHALDPRGPTHHFTLARNERAVPRERRLHDGVTKSRADAIWVTSRGTGTLTLGAFERSPCVGFEK